MKQAVLSLDAMPELQTPSKNKSQSTKVGREKAGGCRGRLDTYDVIEQMIYPTLELPCLWTFYLNELIKIDLASFSWVFHYLQLRAS